MEPLDGDVEKYVITRSTLDAPECIPFHLHKRNNFKCLSHSPIRIMFAN